MCLGFQKRRFVEKMQQCMYYIKVLFTSTKYVICQELFQSIFVNNQEKTRKSGSPNSSPYLDDSILWGSAPFPPKHRVNT